MPNQRSTRSLPRNRIARVPVPEHQWTPIPENSFEVISWEEDSPEGEDNMPRRAIPEVDASTIQFVAPTQDANQLEELRRILGSNTRTSQSLMESMTSVRRNSNGINNDLPRDMARMNTSEIENNLTAAMDDDEIVLRVWGTSVRQRYISVRSFVSLENDRFRIIGKMNGTAFCILEDKLLHASPLPQSDVQSLRMNNRERGSRITRLYHDARGIINDEACAKLNDGYESLVVKRIHTAEIMGDSLLIEVELFNVSAHMEVYLGEGVFIEYADSTDWRRATRDQQIEKLYNIGSRQNPTRTATSSPTDSITTMEEFIDYAHRARRTLVGIKRDGTDCQMQGIGPYVDNGFFATNMNDGMCVRFTTDLFSSITDGGSSSHRSMNPMTMENTLHIAIERGHSVDIAFAGFLPDNMPRNFTLNRINSMVSAYGGETTIITGNGAENGQSISLTSEHLEYVTLGPVRETPNVEMNEQEQITFLTEQVETLRAMVLEMSDSNYAYRELEREKNLASEILAAKISLYGEDSRQAAVARAEYDWIAAKVEAA